LATQPLPRGRRLAIVTNGGGLGIVATDAARRAGLEVALLPPSVQTRLCAVLPPTASVGNPVDLVGDADAARYSNALHALGGEGADAALIVLTAQAATDAAGVARAVIGATKAFRVPVAAAFVGGARVAPGVRALEEAGIPCYAFPEPAVQALGDMALLAERRSHAVALRHPSIDASAAAACIATLAHGVGAPGMSELAPLLAAYGIRCLAGEAAATAEEAATVAARLGGRVALKVRSPDISHKTDVGGVRLGVDAAAVREEARALLARERR
jgi:acetyltransferase